MPTEVKTFHGVKLSFHCRLNSFNELLISIRLKMLFLQLKIPLIVITKLTMIGYMLHFCCLGIHVIWVYVGYMVAN